MGQRINVWMALHVMPRDHPCDEAIELDCANQHHAGVIGTDAGGTRTLIPWHAIRYVDFVDGSEF